MAKFNTSFKPAAPAAQSVPAVERVLAPVLVATPAVCEPVAAPPPTPTPAAAGPRFFMVGATVQVPRLGSHYTLHEGRVISSSGYDIATLTAMGVPLTEVKCGDNPRRARVVSA
jgi:hypothetical protein